MTHSVFQLDVRDWARVQGKLYMGMGGSTVVLPDALGPVLALEARVAALEARMPAGTAKALAAPLELPQAQLPATGGVLTLLTQLQTRLDAVVNALVSAGYGVKV